MTTKRFIQKMDSDKKLNKLLEKIQAEEEAKKVERFRWEEEDTPRLVGKNLQPEKTEGQLTAEIEYYEYLAPILKDLEEHKNTNIKIVNKAKEEYEEKTKGLLEELDQLRNLEHKLFAKGGNSNHWIQERGNKPPADIALGIARLANTNRNVGNYRRF